MFNAPFSESVLSENVDSRTDNFLSSLKTTFLTALSVNTHPEIVLWTLSYARIILSIVLPVNMELSTSRLVFATAKITSFPRVLL